MKVVARTDQYTIYKKRNQRFAVRNAERQWVRGDDKAAILIAHNLIPGAAEKTPNHPEQPEALGNEGESVGPAGEGESGEIPQE